MNLQDLNPLDYFRELGTFSRLLLLVAFVLLFVGIAQGVTVRNPTLITVVVLIFLSLALHYLSDARELHPNPPPNSRLMQFDQLTSFLFCKIYVPSSHQ